MKTRRTISLLLLIGFVGIVQAMAAPTISNVSARQRYPWNGLVDIDVTVTGIEGESGNKFFKVEAVNKDVNAVLDVYCFMPETCGLMEQTIKTNGTYRLVWDAYGDLQDVIIEQLLINVSFADQSQHIGMRFWENGPYWATCNVGAEKAWDSGYYFWWGDTVGYKRENNQWVASDGSATGFSFEENNTPTDGKSNATLQSEGWIASDGVLAAEHDAARVHWGGGWRMPTYADMQELVNNTTHEWITTNGVNGQLVRGMGIFSDKSIFLPAAGYGYGTSCNFFSDDGYFWSSTPELSYTPELSSSYAYYIFFYPGVFEPSIDGYRSYGRSVRPLRGFADSARIARASDSSIIQFNSSECAELSLDTRQGLRTALSGMEELFNYDARWGDGVNCSVMVDGQTLNIEGTYGSIGWLADSLVISGKVWTAKFVSGNTVYTRQFATEDMAVALTSNGVVRVDVNSEMVTPKLMKVDYMVRCVSTNADVKAVAFKDGVRSFANVVRVRTAAEGAISTKVASYKAQSFTWNVAADWDVELEKVMVEVLAKPCEILPQDILHLPSRNGSEAMTITCNAVTNEDVFNALLWCYASEDPELSLENGVLKYNGTIICDGVNLQNYNVLMNYLYGKLGYEILSGDRLNYANKMLNMSMPSSGIEQRAVKLRDTRYE